MKLRRAAELVLLLSVGRAEAERDIAAVPAEGVYIHSETTANFDVAVSYASISLRSEVPVTVQRYSDGARFYMGQKPVLPNEAYVVVTSDCSAEDTDAVPQVTVTEDGEVNVSIDGVDKDGGAAMPFLEPSYYSAVWDWFEDWCGGPDGGDFLPVTATPFGTYPPGVEIDGSDALPEDFKEKDPIQCMVGPGGIAFCGSNEFCVEEEGKCTDPRDIPEGVCMIKPDLCDQIYEPVCGCDKKTYGNDCEATAEGASIDYPGECKAVSDLTTIPPADVTMEPEVLSQEGGQCIGPDDCEKDQFCERKEGACDGEGVCKRRQETCPENYVPVCGCDGNRHSNSCDAGSRGSSVAHEGDCKVDLTTIPPAVGTICIGPDDCEKDQFCERKEGACDGEGVCAARPEFCMDLWKPVCGCDGNTHSNSCYASTEVTSVAYEGECKLPQEAPAEQSCAGLKDCGEDQFCEKEEGACEAEGVCRAIPEVCLALYDPVCGCDRNTYSNSCTAAGGGSSVAYEGPCSSEVTVTAGMTAENNPTDSVASTTTTSTTAAVPAGIVDETPDATTKPPVTSSVRVEPAPSPQLDLTAPLLTGSPAKEQGENLPSEATGAPTAWWATEPEGITSSGFIQRRHFSMCLATALLAIAAISYLFPGSDGRAGFGKLAVAALAVSSVASRDRSGARSTNADRNSSFLNERALQTCKYNVEIMFDGCAHSISVSAPHTRTIHAVIENVTSTRDPEIECLVEYKADIVFPSQDATTLPSGVSNIIQSLEGDFDRCAVIAIGRPFVDSSGLGLTALPRVSESAVSTFASLSWSGDASIEMHSPSTNLTAAGRIFLAKDWTQRALGEHASVASFAAFNIALMTNGAPSNLVEDSLNAALDEVRHARVSFDIASKLWGREVGPGPLPESKHAFTRDLTSLAMALAREGCLDETLSAYTAAIEVDHISLVLEQSLQGSVYSDLDRETLEWIREELVTIGSEESNHSALAWKTLKWVCSVDKEACDDARKEVFNEQSVERRFVQRAESLLMETLVSRDLMRNEWNKIHDAFRTAQGADVCSTIDVASEDDTLVAKMTANVIKQIQCA